MEEGLQKYVCVCVEEKTYYTDNNKDIRLGVRLQVVSAEQLIICLSETRRKKKI